MYSVGCIYAEQRRTTMTSQIDADCCRPNDSERFNAQSQTDPVAPLPPIFEFERQGTTLIVTPVADLRELDYPQIEAGAREMLHLLKNGTIANVVIDFHKTDYYGSTALGFFVCVWKRIRSREGKMAFCNISDHELEILKVTRLDQLWPICSSRADAIRCVQT